MLKFAQMKVSDYTKKQLAKTLADLSTPVKERLKPLSESEKAPKKQPVNCRICEYFYITWQAAMPYGCRAHGFKSAVMPSVVVRSSSNTQCLFFKPKFTEK